MAVAPVESSAAASSVDIRGNSENESGSGKGISPVVTALSVGDDDMHQGKFVPVNGVNRPYFHVDLATAVKSAVQSVSSGS